MILAGDMTYTENDALLVSLIPIIAIEWMYSKNEQSLCIDDATKGS